MRQNTTAQTWGRFLTNVTAAVVGASAVGAGHPAAAHTRDPIGDGLAGPSPSRPGEMRFP